jgi:hypothetical protein
MKSTGCGWSWLFPSRHLVTCYAKAARHRSSTSRGPVQKVWSKDRCRCAKHIKVATLVTASCKFMQGSICMRREQLEAKVVLARRPEVPVPSNPVIGLLEVPSLLLPEKYLETTNISTSSRPKSFLQQHLLISLPLSY